MNARALAVTLAGAALALACVRCGADSGGGPGPDAGGVPPDAAAPDARLTDGATPDASASVVVRTNLILAGHPHNVDVFAPPNAERAVVFLHGGGGTKEGGAGRELGIRLDEPAEATLVVDTAFLDASRTAFVFPQGQALATAPKATTWSNYVMSSGADDVAFLTALAAALRAGTFDARLAPFARVYLAGHSNGGMMANRMWCEAPDVFDAFGSLAGPASVQLQPAGLALDGGQADPYVGAHPCRPATTKPYVGVIGRLDTILQTKDLWPNDVWAVNACLQRGDGGAFVDANLISELSFHDFRAAEVCGESAGEPTVSSDKKTLLWSSCGGRVKLQGVVGADHCVIAGKLPCLRDKPLPSDCTNSLDAESGTRMRDVLVDFFRSTE